MTLQYKEYTYILLCLQIEIKDMKTSNAQGKLPILIETHLLDILSVEQGLISISI